MGKMLLALALAAVAPLTAGAAAQENPSACDRACLAAQLDAYLDAVADDQPAKVPVGAHIKATENGVPTPLGEGLWKTATGFGPYQIRAYDPATGGAVFVGVLKEGAQSTMYSVRLKIAAGKVAEAETVLARIGLPGEAGKAAASLDQARAGLSTPLTAKERSSRKQMLAAAASYYTGIAEGNAKHVAFSNQCHRIENGIALVNNPDYSFDLVSPAGRKLPNFAAMGCSEQFDTGLWAADKVTDLRYPLVDEQHGIVAVYSVYWPYARAACTQVRGIGEVCPANRMPNVSLGLLELFRIKRGQIHEMESVWTVLPQGPAAPTY